MKLKQLAGVLTMALAGGAAQASTVTDNFNGSSSTFSGGWINAPLTTDDYIALSALTANTSSYTFANVAAGSTISIDFWYSSSATNATFVLGGTNGAQSLSSTGGSVAVGFNNPGASSIGVGAGADSFASYTWTNVSAGPHTLTFARNGGILKIDDFSATVTAVPEPETYAMLLAGLGVLGAMARRRKAKQV